MGFFTPLLHHRGRGSNIFAGHFFQVASIPSCKSRFFLDGENVELLEEGFGGGTWLLVVTSSLEPFGDEQYPKNPDPSLE